MEEEPWKAETRYRVDIFGWSNRSSVLVGNQPRLASERGNPIHVPLLLLYVWRDNHDNQPKQVTVEMQALNSICPYDLDTISHLSRHERSALMHGAESGTFDRNLFFNTADWISFEPKRLELYDLPLEVVQMIISVPKDLPHQIKGAEFSVLPKTIKPEFEPYDEDSFIPIGALSGGFSIRIFEVGK